MLDEITDCAVSGWLQDVFLKDEEYQKLGEEEKKAAVECYRRLPEEYHNVVAVSYTHLCFSLPSSGQSGKNACSRDASLW